MLYKGLQGHSLLLKSSRCRNDLVAAMTLVSHHPLLQGFTAKGRVP